MKVKYIYIIYWKCDESEEVFHNLDERNSRINTLENQGFEMGIDFEIFRWFEQLWEADLPKNSKKPLIYKGFKSVAVKRKEVKKCYKSSKNLMNLSATTTK